MLKRVYTYRTLSLALVVFLATSLKAGTDFQTLYDSAKQLKSIPLAEKVLQMAEESGNAEQLGKAHFLIAYYSNANKEYYKALNHYFSALEFYMDAKNYNRQLATLKNIGIIYRHGQFYEKAIEFYQDALALSIEIGDTTQLSRIHYNIARLHRLAGNTEKAKALYIDLIESREEIRIKKWVSNSYLELALIATDDEEDYLQAQLYLDAAVDIYDATNKNPEAELIELTRLNDMGYIKLLAGDLKGSKQVLYQALAQSTSLENNRRMLVKVYGNLGRAYEQAGQLDSSIYMFEKALSIVPEKFDKKYLVTAKLLYDYYKNKSSEKADYYTNQIYNYGDQLATMKSELMQASNEYQIRAAEYRRKLEQKMAQEKRELIRNVLIIASCLLLMAFGIRYYRHEKMKRKKRIRKILDGALFIAPGHRV